MGVLIFVLLVVSGLIAYRFLLYKKDVEKSVQRRGGVDKLYSGFVSFLKERGFEIKELTSNSVYLHFGNEVGKIGAEIVVVAKEKAEISMGETTAIGHEHETTVTIGPNANQREMARAMLAQMPFHQEILPDVGNTTAGERVRDQESLEVIGGNLNQVDEEGLTPIHHAVKEEDIEAVEFLIEVGAEVDVSDQDGKTPLHYSSENGLSEISEVLLGAGASVEAFCDDSITSISEGITPIHLASREGHLDVVKSLRETGSAPVDLQDKEKRGRTPLYYAAENGQSQVVRYLVDSGANVNGVAGYGLPLHNAARHNHDQVISILLDAGAVPDKPDGSGNIPLHKVYSSKGVKLLLSAGSEVDVRNHEEETPLITRAAVGSSTAVDLLIKAGANIEARDERGRTPLLRSAHLEKPDTAKLLLNAGANIDVEDNQGKSVMHWAAYARDSARTARLLIEAGANINKTDKNGQTPLHTLAIRPGYGKAELAKCFAQNGAKLSLEDNDDNTPIELARSEGEDEIVDILEKRKSSWW